MGVYVSDLWVTTFKKLNYYITQLKLFYLGNKKMNHVVSTLPHFCKALPQNLILH